MVVSTLRHAVACALAALLLAPAAHAASVFSVALSAAEEVPVGTAPGSGSGRLELVREAAGYRLFYDLLFSADFSFAGPDPADPLSVFGLHIHAAPRGANGGIVYGMIGPNNNFDGEPEIVTFGDGRTRVTGNWNEMEGNAGQTLAPFLAGVVGLGPDDDTPFYVNLHTIGYPAGAIRGQITVVPLPASAALLGGALLVLVRLGRR
jgi:hypothetical protein